MSINDPSTWPEFAKIDPELDTIVKATGGSPPSFSQNTDVIKMREAMAKMFAKTAAAGPPPDYTGVKNSKIKIPVRDGATINAVVYQPESPCADGSPLVLLFHAGGFCMGFAEMMEPLGLELVKSYCAVVVSVDYRLAPEHTFPVAIEDSYDALKWAATNAPALNANPDKGFLVGGDSAGGNISAVISHMAQDEHLSPPLTGVWLNIPSTVAPDALPGRYKNEYTSRAQNKDAPFFGEEAEKPLLKHYKSVPEDPRFSPLIWPGGHKGLPPHFIQAAGLDRLRDDALLYERELRSEGVSTRMHVYPGVTHSFDGMFPQLSISKKFRRDRSEGFAWLLKK